jgi:hypothetical protein
MKRHSMPDQWIAAPPTPLPGLNEPYWRIGRVGAFGLGRQVHVSRDKLTIIACRV